MIQLDKLERIFEKQKEFQGKADPRALEDANIEYIKDMILAAMDELTEVLRETPWKPWKKQQVFNREKYKEELVDLLHFFVNLCLAADITPLELYNEYMLKNEENHERQEKGY